MGILCKHLKIDAIHITPSVYRVDSWGKTYRMGKHPYWGSRYAKSWHSVDGAKKRKAPKIVVQAHLFSTDRDDDDELNIDLNQFDL